MLASFIIYFWIAVRIVECLICIARLLEISSEELE